MSIGLTSSLSLPLMSELTQFFATLQEIVVSRGKTLELLKPDPNTGKVHTLLSAEVFGIVRSLMSFRLTGGGKVSKS